MQLNQIQAGANRGGAALMLGSAVVLLLLLLSLLWVKQLNVLHALAFVMAALGLFAGWAKLSEPAYFLQYDDKGLRYMHRRGSWFLPWSSFLYSGVPQFEQKKLSYIAFKLTDYDSFLQSLPLRLAVRIMTEQRGLYVEATRQGCSSGQCASELLAEGENFSTARQQYNGIKAAFAHRMQRLAVTTGFDLFVPVELSEADALNLCKQINQTRLQCVQNTAT